MALTNALLTYGDTSRRDDVVLNIVEQLTAVENYFLTTLGKTEAKDTVHSFLVDTLDTAASAAVEMGADFTAEALSVPTRLTNIVEEISKTILVARPQEKVQHYFGQDMTSYQTVKALKNWGNAAEFDILRGSLTSGLSGTAATMNGIIYATSKAANTSAQTSGTAFSATILDALMQNSWVNSNGDTANAMIVGGVMRRVVDTFVQKTNNIVNNPGGPQVIVKTVTTYMTAFGELTIHNHRYIQASGDATGRVLLVNNEKFMLAYLDQPYIKPLAESGAYSKKAVYGSLTVEVRNQDVNQFQTGFLLSV